MLPIVYRYAGRALAVGAAGVVTWALAKEVKNAYDEIHAEEDKDVFKPSYAVCDKLRKHMPKTLQRSIGRCNIRKWFGEQIMEIVNKELVKSSRLIKNFGRPQAAYYIWKRLGLEGSEDANLVEELFLELAEWAKEHPDKFIPEADPIFLLFSACNEC